MRPAALVFDFDGLILDTETSEFHSVSAAFAEHGLELDRAEWQGIIGTADHPHWVDLLEEALGRPVEDREALLVRRTGEHDLVVLSEAVRPGVVELLAAAEDAGVPAAVASSSSWSWVGGHLERLDLRRWFRHVVTRDDVGGDRTRTKPAPDLFLLAAERLDVDPASCVAFEDSPHGARAARAAGMAVVAVPGPMTEGLDFGDADRLVASLADVELADLGALVRTRR
jgi:HAD superfamily hydrolase (TIGR01509 family)